MEDSVSIIFALIVAVVLMFIFPMLDTWERQDDLSYMVAYSLVVDFVDSVRNTGYITTDMLDEFEDSLKATGNSFEIEIEHRAWKAVPSGTNSYKQVYVSKFTTQIEDDLLEKEKYTFNKGDYIYMSIKNTNKTPATTMKQSFYGTTLQTLRIGVPYGGMVRNSPAL